jgi:hypothetical protein
MITLISELKNLARGIILVLLCIVFSVVRFMIPSHPLSPAGSYEAMAHLFIGGLIGAYFVSRDRKYLWMIAALSAVETTAFLMGI